jgi:biopolymer transport protein ExbD
MSRYQSKLSHEFELDLAPLLAVMVKLVPVLLVSSAFMQLMVVESTLPDPVAKAMAQAAANPTFHLKVYVLNDGSVKVISQNVGGAPAETLMVKAQPDGGFDYPGFRAALEKIKDQHPDQYRLELYPARNVAYRDLIRLMDFARKPLDAQKVYPVGETTTNLMFPDVVFANLADSDALAGGA